MDITAIQGFLDQNDPAARSRAFQYFEQLKASDNGWQLSIECLLSGQCLNESVKFFCFQVLAHYVKIRYQQADESQQLFVRNFISRWILLQSTTPEPLVIRNKAAQFICMVFLFDYPARWPSFFKDLLQTISHGLSATEFYLRVLISVNAEIADRETTRSHQEMDCFTLIKDTMRDTCVKELVDSWHHILISSHQNQQPEILCLCLNVIGAYISWIDINLIANAHFVSLFVSFLSVPVVRESTCDCIHEIITKGMDPVAKIKLVESFVVVLDEAGAMNGVDSDEEFQLKLGNLVNGFGTTILSSWSKLQKLSDDKNNLLLAENTVRSKVGLLLKFLNNDDDDVSQSVIEFTREYLQFLKQQSSTFKYTKADAENVKNILYIVIDRYKYDKSTNFITQGHEEAEFESYRKALKNIFDHLAVLDIEVVFDNTKAMIVKVFHQWQSMPFEDVEVSITFLYLLGEVVPICPTSGHTQNAAIDSRRSSVAEMVRMLVTCGIINHGHVAVTLQFFETVVRFEKFFTQEPQLIPEILVAFMDSRGLRHSDSHIRSRTSYLFSRFIKCLKPQIQNYTEDILKQLQDLLILAPPVNGFSALLSPDDQLYLYETAAILIISSQFEPEQRQLLLKNLLTPVFEKFGTLLQSLDLVNEEQQRHSIAKCMNHAVAVTSRTSKAFSSQLTMKSCGCDAVYLKALEVFLEALTLPCEQMTLQSAVRQYLHRMVVCLEDEVLPYFPLAAEQLLKSSDVKSIQEFIPLINQAIIKFKIKIVPFLQQIFMPFVTIIFNNLSASIEDGDQHAQNERQLLQRSYFLFISAIIANNTADVIACQAIQNLEQVLMTVIQGAVNFPDPVAQKTCFSILKKMVELWGGPNGVPEFVKFVYNHIIPACFMAPLKDTFDLSDAQTILALSESALCLKMIHDKRGDEMLTFLQSQYLPQLNISLEEVQTYCQTLKGDTRYYKRYSKLFFEKLRR